jgi:hypothetical protein
MRIEFQNAAREAGLPKYSAWGRLRRVPTSSHYYKKLKLDFTKENDTGLWPALRKAVEKNNRFYLRLRSCLGKLQEI